MKRFLCFIVFAAAFLSISFVSYGQDFKIAVIDMKKVFADYEKTKAMELKLTQQLDVYKEYLGQLNQQYNNINKQFTEARDAAQNITLNIAERESNRKKAQDLYETLQIKEQELKSYAEERKTLLDKMQEDLRNEVLTEIKRCVRNHAVLYGYALVLDSSGDSLNDVSMVIFFQDKLDITESVITDLNRGYRTNAKDPVPDKKTDATK